MREEIKLSQTFQNDYFFSNPGPVFSPANFQRIRDYFFEYVSRIPEPLRYLNCANDPRFKPAIADLVAREELLSVVRPILGDDLVFWSIGVCYKPAFSDYQVGWHIDSHCWMRDQVIFPPEALILFLSLTDMTAENGAMELIPRLNNPKFYDHTKRDKDVYFFEYEIADDELAGQKPYLVTMKENQLCGFASHVPHRSGPNRSAQPRLGLTLRYLQSSVKITGTPLDGRDSYLISGVDHAGNRYVPLQQRQSIGGLSTF